MPRQARPATSAAAALLVDRAALLQPEARADLAHAHQRDREELRLLLGQAGVVGDHVGDQLGALGGHAVDPGADRGLVGQVGLEDQPEGALGVGDVVVEGVHRRGHALLVVLGRLQGPAGGRDDLVAGLVEQREVEVELAREVLVEHRLGDPGALGDVVHGGRVVALRDEDLERGAEQLGATSASRQPHSLAVGRRSGPRFLHGAHVAQPTSRPPGCCPRERASQ